jgi:hypothetical protein
MFAKNKSLGCSAALLIFGGPPLVSGFQGSGPVLRGPEVKKLHLQTLIEKGWAFDLYKSTRFQAG